MKKTSLSVAYLQPPCLGMPSIPTLLTLYLPVIMPRNQARRGCVMLLLAWLLAGLPLFAQSQNTTAPNSKGLPPLPVNTLIYQAGNDDILYAGTDVGVFRYDKATDSWTCFNNGLPVAMISDIEIDYCCKKIYAASYGKGIWAADLPDAPAELITTNTTIPATAIKNAAEDIIVQTGVTLTVQGTINMAKGKRILVEPSGVLKIDGGTLTNRCDEMWNGITVEGNAALPQTYASQGAVILKNNATIEYADNAITLGRYYDWGYDINSGGDTLYREPMPHLPNIGQERRRAAKKAIKAATTLMLTVSPNPATDYVVLHYNVAETGTTMQIVDAAGHTLLNKTLDNTIGDITLTTADWVAGAYRVLLITHDKVIDTQSIIITK
jgi:hypothetical protein